MTEQTLGAELAEKAEEPIAKRGEQRTARDLIQGLTPEFARALPKTLPVETFVRVVLTELKQNPQLETCTEESLLAAIMLSAQLGLQPGPLGEVYFVPFKNRKRGTVEVTWIPGYKGLRRLAFNAGITVNAHVVYEHDHFAYELGDNEHITHKPHLEGDRGKAVAYYAIATFENGLAKARSVLTVTDAEAVRERFAKSKTGPWFTDFDAMARKTAIRRVCGDVPLQAEPLAVALRNDGEPLDVRNVNFEAGADVIDGEVVSDVAEPVSGSGPAGEATAPGPEATITGPTEPPPTGSDDYVQFEVDYVAEAKDLKTRVKEKGKAEQAETAAADPSTGGSTPAVGDAPPDAAGSGGDAGPGPNSPPGRPATTKKPKGKKAEGKGKKAKDDAVGAPPRSQAAFAALENDDK